jgi:hypothetical protein
MTHPPGAAICSALTLGIRRIAMPSDKSEVTPAQNEGEVYTRAACLENSIEAQILGPALFDEGIPHRIRSFHDTAYDGLFQTQMGWGEVRCPAAYKEKVLEILTEIRSSEADTVDFEPEAAP